jgi:signal transduction histidine kinase
MMPLRDGKDHVFGCIALAARESGAFEGRFRSLAEFATRYAGAAIEAIELKHQPDLRARELMAHSLKTRVERVAGAAETLKQVIDNFFGAAGDAARVAVFLRDIETAAARHRLPIEGQDRQGLVVLRALQNAFDVSKPNSFETVLSDLDIHTKDLLRTAAYLAGDVNNEENPFETSEMKWSGTPAALRDCLLGCVMPVARKRGVDVAVPPPHELGSDVRLRVSPLVMSDIINNFCDNALKYSAAGTAIRIRFRWARGLSAYLEFRNLAPRLSSDEIDMLGTPGFRSTYARSRTSDGQGKGLISNRRLAERWNMKIFHRQESLENESSANVWHVFGLEIPSDLLFEDAVHRSTERLRHS